MGSHFLLQGIFLTQPTSPAFQADSLPLSYLGSPNTGYLLIILRFICPVSELRWIKLRSVFDQQAGDEGKKKRNMDSREEVSAAPPPPKPTNPLPLSTYLDKSKWEETLCLPLGAIVEGLAPVVNEQRECTIVQVPVKVYIGLPWKQSKLWEGVGVDARCPHIAPKPLSWGPPGLALGLLWPMGHQQTWLQEQMGSGVCSLLIHSEAWHCHVNDK